MNLNEFILAYQATEKLNLVEEMKKIRRVINLMIDGTISQLTPTVGITNVEKEETVED